MMRAFFIPRFYGGQPGDFKLFSAEQSAGWCEFRGIEREGSDGINDGTPVLSENQVPPSRPAPSNPKLPLEPNLHEFPGNANMAQSPLLRYSAALAVGLMLVGHQTAQAQYGIVLSGAGPDNRSMAGASTAAPLDASGALYWNPAAITGLDSSQLGFGLEALYSHSKLSSSVGANSFGPGIPPIPLAGTDRSDNGILALPTVGLVYQPVESPWVYGLGLFSAGGFCVNYPASTSNPILTPQPPNGFGLGPLSAELEVFQVVPTVALKVTDQISIGIAPTLNLATLTADPLVLTAPNPDGDYPAADHSRVFAGGGVQAGIFWKTDSCWNLGTSIKSPQWFETFQYNAVNELGEPRTIRLRFDYPLIASAGAAYTGFERWTLAADFHFINYHDTAGFDHTGFSPTGAVRGIGWDDVYAVALGAQYEVTPCCSVRFGYSYNNDPIDSGNTIFNAASPLILEHTIYVGASYNFSANVKVSLAYAHAFENSQSGPIVSPLGTLPGSSVQSTVSADTFLIGATFKF
jgi:long-chain fatty acid transport protein